MGIIVCVCMREEQSSNLDEGRPFPMQLLSAYPAVIYANMSHKSRRIVFQKNVNERTDCFTVFRFKAD